MRQIAARRSNSGLALPGMPTLPGNMVATVPDSAATRAVDKLPAVAVTACPDSVSVTPWLDDADTDPGAAVI